ncbi:odorant receptor 49b-like [Phymastichus coffea]|uniref:odorant receptor 49b-like n=1 Tax=Phymastichus coffea TaxID=108790 RepID=UPI00273C975D|nr:odorant receptor 49b-like [Phymastichus coffea]
MLELDSKQTIKETIAPIPFRILKCIGLWRPLTWSNWLKSLYTGFSVLTLILLITITLTVLLGVYQMPMTDDLFAENVFLMFALINACFKAINVLSSRALFIEMITMIQHKRWLKLRNSEEEDIQDKYSKTIRKISIYFTTAVFIAIVLRCVAPLVDQTGQKLLPVDAYCPCNVENPGCYWLLFWHQSFGTGIATLVHAAKDCLIIALLLQTCAQLEILKYRLLSIADESKEAHAKNIKLDLIETLERESIADCVQDHESVFKFSRILNKSLSVMLFGQIAVTIPNLCLSIFLLSTQHIASVEFMMTMQFFSAVVIELFFFCWYGNEVTLTSLDVESAICEMEWEILANSSKKDLLYMMMRTSKPILFRVGPIMNMNIDSFLSIMKSSYSAFSVLQSTGA